MPTRNKPALSEPVTAAEFERLRRLAIAQAAELAVLRWQYANLVDSDPVARRLTVLKRMIARYFPRIRSRLGPLVRALRRRPETSARDRSAALVDSRPIALGERVQARTPILIVGDADVYPLLSTAAADAAILVTADAGIVASSGAQEAGLQRRPTGNSLAGWMSAHPSRLRQMGTVVVDARDLVSLSLLRGRMAPGQTLVLTHASGEHPAIVTELGIPCATQNDLQLFERLPDGWIDPLGDDARLAPAGAAIAWPKISVVMVSFNQAAFLEEGLRSVLDQCYPDLEFIVVDGQSSDGSIDILERYRGRLSRLIIEKDSGQSDGLNKGFAVASGDILTWVNSDDLLEPGALFRVAQAFIAYDVDMVVGGCRQIGLSRSDILHNHHTSLPFGLPVALPLGLLLELDRMWFAGAFFFQPEVFFTRDIWQRAGGCLRVDLYYVLDYDLWVRMAAAGATIVHIPEFLACSRTHEQQKTTTGMPFLPEVQRLIREYGRRLANPPVPTSPA